MNAYDTIMSRSEAVEPEPEPVSAYDRIMSRGQEPSWLETAGRAVQRGAAMGAEMIGSGIQAAGAARGPVPGAVPGASFINVAGRAAGVFPESDVSRVGRGVAEYAGGVARSPELQPLRQWKLWDSEKGGLFDREAWDPSILANPDFYADFLPEQAALMAPFFIAAATGGLPASVGANMAMEGGNAYREAINAGASEADALRAAATTAAAQVPLTYLTQGLAGKIPGASKVAGAARAVADIGGEMVEETGQSVAQDVAAKTTYAPETEIDFNRALEEGIMALPAAGPMQAGASTLNRVLSRTGDTEVAEEPPAERPAGRISKEAVAGLPAHLPTPEQVQQAVQERLGTAPDAPRGEAAAAPEVPSPTSPERAAAEEFVGPPPPPTAIDARPQERRARPIDANASIANYIRSQGGIRIREATGEVRRVAGKESGAGSDLYRQGILTKDPNASDAAKIAQAMMDEAPQIAAMVPHRGSTITGDDLLYAIEDRDLLFRRPEEQVDAQMEEGWRRQAEEEGVDYEGPAGGDEGKGLFGEDLPFALREDVDEFRRALSAVGYDGEVRAARPTEADREAAKVAEALGYRVAFVSGEGMPATAYTTKSGNAVLVSGSADPTSLVHHEAVHILRQNDEGAYDALRDFLEANSREILTSARETYRSRAQSMPDYLKSLDEKPGTLQEEAVAQLAENLSPEILARMDRTVLRKLLDAVHAVLKRIAGKVPTETENAVKAFAKSLEAAAKGEAVGEGGRFAAPEGPRTEQTEAGDQTVIEDAATRRRVPTSAKKGGGSLEGTPLGEGTPEKKADRGASEQLGLFALAPPTDSPEFKRWFGDSKVVDENGEPLVVYHGTTHDFSQFSGERGNIENHFGNAFYFTDSSEDVNENYAGEGPDLTSRIEHLAEQLQQDEDFENDFDEKRESGEVGYHASFTDYAEEEARRRLSSGTDNVMPVYVSMQNPLDLREGGTEFTFEEEYDEDADEYAEPEGTLLDFADALRRVASRYDDVDLGDFDVLQFAYDGELDAGSLIEALRESEGFNYATDPETGDLASSQILREAIEESGFDGIIMDAGKAFGSGRKFGRPMAGTDSATHYIAFRPEQIKSATGNRGTYSPDNPDIRFALAVNSEREPLAPAFYSAVHRAVEGMDFRSMPASDLLSRLKKTQGVKPEELEATRFEDWLKSQGKVTKEDVLEFLDENQVRVEVVEKGEPSSLAQEQLIAGEITEDEFDARQGRTKYGPDSHPTLTLPGAKEGSYREMLLTLPERERVLRSGFEPQLVDGKWRIDLPDTEAGNPRQPIIKDTREEAIRVAKNFGWITPETRPYHTTHWDEPNVLAHIRFNERTDAEGNRVLFVEEIQSDWHQAGRKKGYKSDLIAKKENGAWYVYNKGTGALIVGGVNSNFTEREAIDAVVARGMDRAVPDAPFKKTWPELSFKHVLRYAAENGFDRVAWTTGEQQNTRYDLSRQVNEIGWRTEDGVKRVRVDVKNGAMVRFVVGEDGTAQQDDTASMDIHREISGRPIDEIVGKEIADQILGRDAGLLEGAGLKIGGQGMRSFYDKMLPSAVKKLVRKYDKSHPGSVPGRISLAKLDIQERQRSGQHDSPWDDSAVDAHALDITPALRDAVLFQGQPMFALKKGQRTGPGERARSLPVSLEEAGRTPGTDLTYATISNEEAVAAAKRRIEESPEKAYQWVMDAIEAKTGLLRRKGESASAEHTATALGLISHYQNEAEKGNDAEANYEKATRLASATSAHLTRLGQAVQAASIISRLSPEGVALTAAKKIQRINEELPAAKRREPLTAEETKKFADLARDAQRWQELGLEARVMSGITQKIADGEPLTGYEVQILKVQVQKIQDLLGIPAPTSPQATKRKQAAWKNVLEGRLEQSAKDARARLRDDPALADLRLALPSKLTPQQMAGLAEIGAGHMHKVGSRYVDWSAAMVKDLGEPIRPHLRSLYKEAKAKLSGHSRISRQVATKAKRIQDLITLWEENADYLMPDLNEEASKTLDALVREVKDLTGDAQVEKAMELQYALNVLEEPSAWRKVSTAQTIAHLLNPKTNVRNIIGNELFWRVERVNKYLATPVDWARSVLTGADRTVTFRKGGQGGYWRPLLKGMKYGWGGKTPGNLVTQFDLELKGPAFRGRYNPLTYLEKAMGATLRGFDYAAYTRAKNATLGEMAVLAALNRGQKPTQAFVDRYVQNADERALELADDYGRYATFQDDNFLSEAFGKFKRGLNRFSTAGATEEFGLGDLVLKYPKTPANLMARALEYSPAGFLRSMYILSEPKWKNVEKNPREATLALSRAITGTAGFTGLGVYLVMKGVLSGKEDRDWDVNQFLRDQTGEGPYQVNLSALKRWVLSGFKGDPKKQAGDTLYTYDWAQPVAVSLAIGAQIGKALNGEEVRVTDTAGTILASVSAGAETIFEQPLLRGIQDLFGNKYDEDKLKILYRLAEGVPSSFTPTFLNQLRQYTGDNKARITYDPNPLQKAINRAIYKMPWVYRDLPVAYKTLGVEVPREVFRSGRNNLFNVFFNPGFVDKYEVSQQVVALMEPYEAEGRRRQFPRRVKYRLSFSSRDFRRKFGIDRLVADLDPEDISTLQRVLARYTTEELNKKTRSDLTRMTPEEQERHLADGVNDAYDRMRDYFLANMARKYIGRQPAPEPETPASRNPEYVQR